MKKFYYAIIFAVLLLAAVIIYQSINYKAVQGKFSNTQALSALTKTETSGRNLTKAEMESGQFNNLKVKIDGMSCISCSDTVFYGLINMKGIVNAKIQKDTSCIIYDRNNISRKDILNSELFQSGIYMAEAIDDNEIRSSADAKCL